MGDEMRMIVKSRVKFDGMIINDVYTHEFPDGMNVFGRVLEYRNRMRKVFPGCEFELVSAKTVKK